MDGAAGPDGSEAAEAETRGQRLRQWAELVELLGFVSVAANEAPDAGTAFARVLERVCLHHDLAFGHALVVEPSGVTVSSGVSYLADPRFEPFRAVSAEVSFPPGVGLPGRVLQSGQPAWIVDVTVDANFPRATPAGEMGLRAAFAFPVLAGEDVVAVLEFFSTVAAPPQALLLGVMGHVGAQLGRVFERQRAAEALGRSEARLRQILDTAGDAFVAMDDQGRITDWNQAAEAVFGWPREAVVGRLVADVVVPPDLRTAHWEGLRRFLATGEAKVLGQRLELTALHGDGHAFPVELTLWTLPADESWSFYAFGRDISERKRSEEALRHQALHDQLTGLPNRTLLLDRLAQALARTQRHPGHLGPALLFVDLDRFKTVNDSLGHEAGDRLLVAVAERLQSGVRATDTVARLSGGEVVVLCDGVSSARGAVAAAERLRATLTDPIRLDGDLVHVDTSIGIALADAATDSPEALVQAADVAMYRAKKDGGARIEIFDEAMRSQTLHRLRTEARLAQAIAEGELRLYYQPIVALDDGRVVGVEALVRWLHPDHGLLPPADFLGVAEESGLIVPLGTWVLTEACRQARRWESELDFPTPLGISVNLSGRQLAQSDFTTVVSEVAAEAGVDPKRVELGVEITESVLMRDPEAAAASLESLRAIGMRLAIDDFGTGYSSLAYLKWFPLDTVKIDRSFITGSDSHPADRAIVGAIVDLAHSLRMTAVAEGVETRAQLDRLRGLGCDHAQGFFFARPQPADWVTARLAAWPGPGEPGLPDG